MKRARCATSVLAAIALVSAACGTESETTSDPGQPDTTVDGATTTGTESDDSTGSEAVAADIAACENPEDHEGTLVWYSALSPDSMEDVVAAFEEEFPGAEVESLRLSSGELGTRYATEREADGRTADVLTIADPNFLQTGFEEGWFEEELALPALEEWPDEFYEGGVATTGVVPFILGYNSNTVSEEDVPQTWEDLLDPKWAGQMQIGDPRAASSYLAVAELWYQELGEDFLTGLADQDPTPFASSVPASEQLAAGSFAFLVPSPNVVLVTLAEEGAPVAGTALSPTTGAELDSAISTESPEPCLANLFMNFILTEDGQRHFNGGGGTSVLGQLSDDMLPLPDEYFSMGPLLESAAEHEDELLRLLGLN